LNIKHGICNLDLVRIGLPLDLSLVFLVGSITPFANLIGQQATAFSMRELAYTWLANTGVAPYGQEW
jgi:hypothetical protein